ncbi:hypothetical protein H105_07834 [Trichophyton soudanense CBS 452.61]|uniref:Uncharacterized protein n=1 Tax=Trichophyton soudanense CBS 452.61 TaxID=1215331 RepID=A0A022XH66_TRISD|nr:hypothetical protein H105_07834 [Trichophyton soudanense CBS 452.61]
MATNSSGMEESHDTPGFKNPELPQTQSVLFNKLPPELRDRHWGGSDEGKLHAVDQSIALLKVCQRMSTIFKVIRPKGILTLFPPAAHSSIHTFWIDILLNSKSECDMCNYLVDCYLDETIWSEIVTVLNEQMPSLRHLHISIIRRKNSKPVEHFRALLEENLYPTLTRMKKLQCFRVLVNFENAAPANAPFEVISGEYLAAYETKDDLELVSNETEEEVSTDNVEDENTGNVKEESTEDVEDEYVTQHEEKAWDIIDGWKIAFHLRLLMILVPSKGGEIYPRNASESFETLNISRVIARESCKESCTWRYP